MDYYLVPKPEKKKIEKDYQSLLSWLEARGHKLFKYEEFKYKVTGKDRSINIELIPSDEKKNFNSDRIIRIVFADINKVEHIREFAIPSGYKIYSEQINGFIPENLFVEIFDECDFWTTNPSQFEMLADQGFEPIFVYWHREDCDPEPHFSPLSEFTIYAKKINEDSIHMINWYELNLFAEGKEMNIKNLSREVAPNIEEFTQRFDKNLIPTIFPSNSVL